MTDTTLPDGFTVERGLEIAVRGGGHGVAGTGLSDGGVVVDLRRMNGAEVDPAARTITIGGGAVWADFDQACQPHGPAATGGRGVGPGERLPPEPEHQAP
jgi:FAD/FMN-containing dehydrogenase